MMMPPHLPIPPHPAMKRVLPLLAWTLVAALGAGSFAVLALHRGETVNAAWLVIAPETQMASGDEENATDFASSATGRGAIWAANSALMLKNSFRSGRPRLRRARNAPLQSGSQMPMSEA